jgi:hypothetical protein
MSSASEILALHKKILPAKYDKKRQPNIIGTDELPFPICITQSQLKGGHHFHFQHGPYKVSNIAAICSEDYNRTRKDVLQRHNLLRQRFEEIQLFATNTEWYSENILDIALTLHSPEENILTFPDFFPSSSELTYTVL